jgi:hypothetical protein
MATRCTKCMAFFSVFTPEIDVGRQVDSMGERRRLESGIVHTYDSRVGVEFQ